MGTVCCVDLSHYEAKSATSFWDAYKAGFVLFILKASQTLGYDWAFDGFNRRLKTVSGALRGAYHYGTGGATGVKQADHFLEVVGDDMPLLALDYEPTDSQYGGVMPRDEAEAFVTRIHAKTGHWPLLYGGSLLKDQPVQSGSPLLHCELWLSQYGPNAVLPHGWAKYRLWQFTGDGIGPEPHDVPGIGTNLYISKFPGTVDDLRRWFGGLTA